MSTRNITLSLSDELIKKAKVLAAKRETSISALVTKALEQLVGEDEDYQAMWAAEMERMRSSHYSSPPGWKFDREWSNDRDAQREEYKRVHPEGHGYA